jgi:hypothetical protein
MVPLSADGINIIMGGVGICNMSCSWRREIAPVRRQEQPVQLVESVIALVLGRIELKRFDELSKRTSKPYDATIIVPKPCQSKSNETCKSSMPI